MSAWGIGIFENDDAVDWLSDYAQAGALEVVDALFDVLEAEKIKLIDMPVGSMGLAAAETVAFAMGVPDPQLDRDIKTEIAAHSEQVRELPDVVSAAQRAVCAVSDCTIASELFAVWEEQGRLDAFFAQAAQLQGRLSQVAT